MASSVPVWVGAVALVVACAGQAAAGAECQHVAESARAHGLSQCAYARAYCADAAAGFIDWPRFRYCTSWVGPLIIWPALVLAFAVLLSLLSSTASTYFAPCLHQLSRSLRLSPNVAGVTLLAFGNAAPDIFTGLAGVRSDNVPLVLSSAVGAGLCVVSFCLGCVIIAAPARVEHSTLFYRDVAAYIVITGFIITISVGHRVPMWLALSFLVLYTLYAASVIAASFMAPAPSAVTKVTLAGSAGDMNYALLDDEREDQGQQARVELQAQTAHGPDALPLYDFGPPGDEQRSRPRTSEPDMLSSATFLKRARRAVEHPFTVLRSATIPDPDGGWTFHDRIQICASPVVIVVLSTLAFANTSVLGMSPWALAVAVFGSAALSRLTYRPKALVASFGFVSSIAWLSLLAAELVGVVQAMGIIANLSTSTLGLTVLAIANSAGDIVTNVTIATHTANGPASAISACFGAPIMSDLLGLQGRPPRYDRMGVPAGRPAGQYGCLPDVRLRTAASVRLRADRHLPGVSACICTTAFWLFVDVPRCRYVGSRNVVCTLRRVRHRGYRGSHERTDPHQD